jgi:hypothetical protein
LLADYTSDTRQELLWLTLRILETPPKRVLLNPPVSSIKWGKEQDGALASHSQELRIPLGTEALLTMYKNIQHMLSGSETSIIPQDSVSKNGVSTEQGRPNFIH